MNKADQIFYSKLELNQNASVEEVKKRYRELAKKYHPDNQTTGDSDKFKDITEAYNQILNPPAPAPSPFGNVPFSGGYPFGRSYNFYHEPETSDVEIRTEVSFLESVLGCKKEIVYSRKVKCKNCNGTGNKLINNGCDQCGGSGQHIRHHNGSILVTACSKCRGKRQTEKCSTCSGDGTLVSDVTVNVMIPAGVVDGNILKLAEMGNYFDSFGPFTKYTDALLHISVTADPDLSLDGKDVICKLKLSLSEAVKGCKKTVRTIEGACDIEIKPMSRNKDEVIISNMGVNKQGNQRVVLDVDYPLNILELINSSEITISQ